MNDIFIYIYIYIYMVLITIKLKYLLFILGSGSDLVLRHNPVFQTTPLKFHILDLVRVTV